MNNETHTQCPVCKKPVDLNRPYSQYSNKEGQPYYHFWCMVIVCGVWSLYG